jgi:hypothetical protein
MSRGKRSTLLLRTALCAAMLLAWPASARTQAQGIHGENSSFLGEGVAMVWGVLRGASEASTQVVLRIAPAGGEYRSVSVDGIDPFTQGRKVLVERRPLGDQLEIRTPRATFADLPRREIHFYKQAGRGTEEPSLTVYFMGLPDTTPEFGSEAALLGYLDHTLEKLLSGKGRTP